MPSRSDTGVGRVLVIVPTYNEADNITAVADRLRAAVPEARLLIADDNSPDGTGKLADEMAEPDKHIHVLHRPGKRGVPGGLPLGHRARP